MRIRNVSNNESWIVSEVVSIHMETFEGFFLTFLGRSFLRQMYKAYCDHPKSGLLVAEENNKVLGFLAYSEDLSDLYKQMIRTKLIPFAWYAFCAFLRKPAVFLRLVRAFLKPGESKRDEDYVELASIGVLPVYKSKGIGSELIEKLKTIVDFKKYVYITLETDAINNDAAIHFYEKNGFVCKREFSTHEGRLMREYIYVEEK